jgi:hypothetical protein
MSSSVHLDSNTWYFCSVLVDVVLLLAIEKVDGQVTSDEEVGKLISFERLGDLGLV